MGSIRILFQTAGKSMLHNTLIDGLSLLDYMWIIVRIFSDVGTLILTAPIYYKGIDW